MSTTIVAQLTGEAGVDLADQWFGVITVREDVEPDEIEDVTLRISREDIDDDGEVDDLFLRSELASELKTEGLTLERLEIVRWVWFGE